MKQKCTFTTETDKIELQLFDKMTNQNAIAALFQFSNSTIKQQTSVHFGHLTLVANHHLMTK